VACVLPFLFAAVIALCLMVAGVHSGDAWVTAATFLRYVLGLAIGGTSLGMLSLRIVGRDATWKDLLGPSCAAAAWAPFVFVTFLGIAQLAGAGAASGLYAGLLVLLWGAAAGMGIVGGNDAVEPGRLLVATCLGLSGCLFGFWGSHQLSPEVSVTAVRAPFRTSDIRPGNVLLVRSDTTPVASSVVLLRETGTREAVFVTIDRNGYRTPLGKLSIERKMLQDWNIAGRVFFRFGSPGGWSVVGTEQTPQLSQD